MDFSPSQWMQGANVNLKQGSPMICFCLKRPPGCHVGDERRAREKCCIDSTFSFLWMLTFLPSFVLFLYCEDNNALLSLRDGVR